MYSCSKEHWATNGSPPKNERKTKIYIREISNLGQVLIWKFSTLRSMRINYRSYNCRGKKNRIVMYRYKIRRKDRCLELAGTNIRKQFSTPQQGFNTIVIFLIEQIAKLNCILNYLWFTMYMILFKSLEYKREKRLNLIK